MGGGGNFCSRGFYMDIHREPNTQQENWILKSFLSYFGIFLNILGNYIKIIIFKH